jgi:peptide/nickel transport system permease protein
MAAAVRGGRLGRVIDVASLGGLALPNFWVAIVLVSIFAVKLGLLPATGYIGLTEDPARWIESLVLPVCALSLFGITILAKQTRDAVLEVLERDYVRMIRANGLSETRLLLKHVLRNAAIPVVTVVGLVAIGSLMGTVFVEQVFVLPGLGTLATQSTLDHDLPVILGIGVYFTLIVILVNLMVDLAYSMLNPRVRVR